MMQGNAALRAVLGRGSSSLGSKVLRKGKTTRTRTVSNSTQQIATNPATSTMNSHLRVCYSTSATRSLLIRGNEFSSPSNYHHQRLFSSTKEDAKKEEGEEKTTEETTATETEAEETAAADASEDSEPSFEEKLSILEGEVKNLKDQLLRSLAEQENTRQIAKRDVSAAKNYAIKSFAKSLLEVSDNLHRALDAVPAEALSASDDNNLKTLYEGVKMTNDGLTKAFGSNGITAFCQEPGDVFDPTKMNALMEYPDPSKEPGTVGQVIKVGFTLNDRVLRPAEVGVVKKP